jgi:hypothetical protein
MKYRLAYTYDKALGLMANGEPVYEFIDGEFELIESNEEMERCHPHDTFYSGEVSSEAYDIAVANGERAIAIIG